MHARVRNESNGRVLADRAQVASTFWRRAKGLLGRGSLAEGEGLLLFPCSSVHMMGMRFPLDILFTDREGKVVGLVPGLKPWRVAAARGAYLCIELPAGTLSRTETEVGHTVKAWSGGVELVLGSLSRS